MTATFRRRRASCRRSLLARSIPLPPAPAGWLLSPLPCLLLAPLFALLLAPPPPASAARLGGLPALVDSLWAAGARDSSQALLARGLAAARAAGDSSLAAGLLVRGGAHAMARGQALRAEPALREALALAQARGDSATVAAAVRWLSVAVGSQGRLPEARALYRRLLDLAVATGDRRHEGWARVGLAWDAWREGRADEARRGYERAAALFRDAGEAEGEIWARNGLGTALSRGGDYAAALAAYLQAAALAREAGFAAVEMMALSNAGSLEYSLGDPGRAEERFARARALARAGGQEREVVTPGVNLAICRADLGRLDEAEAALDSCLAETRRGGYRDLEAIVLCETAALRERQERPHEAARAYRRALALGEAAPFEVRVRALVGLSAALAAADSGAAALAALARAEPWFAGRRPDDLELMFRLAFGRRWREAGREREALGQLRRAADLARRLGLASWRVEALAHAARCERALGRPDSALASLEEAARAWEEQRGIPLDPRWREQRGAAGHLLYAELADLTLGPGAVVADLARVRDAFDRLQAFKARTLLERMAGPGAEPPARGASDAATLAALQAGVLRPGELLLDFYLGPDVSFLFAVTADQARAARLPGEAGLAERVRLYHGLLAAPPPPGAARPTGARSPASARAAAPTPRGDAVTEAGAALARDLLGAAADLLAQASRVVVSPDGVLNLLPFGELPLDGLPLDESPVGESPVGGAMGASGLAGAAPPSARGDPAGPAPLLARCEVVRVPAAAVLARTRQTARGAAGSAPLRLLAVGGGHDAAGRPLAGARREARELDRRYRGVTVLLPDRDAGGVNGGPRWGADAGRMASGDLAAADVLHLAAHLRADDQSPWRTRLEFAAADTAGLTAAQVLRLPLRARLAFLSSCGTASGRILSGEGVVGMTGAFLAAGTPAAVATLWPVDDAATVRLVTGFYDGLATGLTAAAALRRAQLATRAEAATAAPFFWAGFVLTGDGAVTAPLAPRPPWERWARPSPPPRWATVALFGALAIAGAGGLAAAGAGRRRGSGRRG